MTNTENANLNSNTIGFYYRKFSWVFVFVGIAVSCFWLKDFTIPFIPKTYGVLQVLPLCIIWFLMAFLLGYFAIYFCYRKGILNKKTERIYRISCSVIIAVVFFDKIVLTALSTAADSIKLSKNPTGFFASMVYMAYNGRRIWLNGIMGTLKLSLLGTLIGFILAILLVFLRIQTPDKRDSELSQFLKLIGSTFSKMYTTIVRGTPMMVQVFIIYYSGFAVVRSFMPNAPISQVNKVWSFFMVGLITVSLNTTAYIAEVLRGGIEALDKGQTEAARSLGMTQWQAMTKVIFPQAVKNSVPAICNEFIINIKDTAVLNAIGVSELMFATGTVAGIYYKNLETYCISAVIYLFLTFTLTKVLSSISAKMDMPVSKGIPSSN